MAVVGSMNGLLDLETSGWKKGAKDAETDVTSLSNKFKAFVKDASAAGGKGSAIGQAAKLMVGHGAVAGIGAAVAELNRFSGELKNVVEEFREGKITGGEMFEKIVSNIPIIGQAWQLGRNIREMITGEEAAQKKLNDQLKMQVKITNDACEAAHKLVMETNKMHEEMSDEKLKLQQQAELAAITDPTLKAKRQAEIEAENELAKLKKQNNLEDIAQKIKGAEFVLARDKATNLANKSQYIQADELKLKALLKEQAVRTKDMADLAILVEQEKQNKIKAIDDKAADDKADKDAQALDKQMKAAEEAAKKEATAKLQAEKKLLKELQDQHKAIWNSVSDDKSGYQAASVSQRQTGITVLATPHIATKMERLGEEQRDLLRSIEHRIDELSQTMASEDEQIATFGS